MSAFITNQLPKVNKIGNCMNQETLQQPHYSVLEPYTDIPRQQDVDILWTRSNFLIPLSSGAAISAENSMSQWWEWYWPRTGGTYRKVVQGVVRDSNGNVVTTGATVRLFNTTTGLQVDSVTSDAGGNYKAGDPNAVQSFAVGDLPGAPETMGTTIQELTGT